MLVRGLPVIGRKPFGSDEPTELTLPEFETGDVRVLYGNYEETDRSNGLDLRPYEAAIYRL
jgi:hypothetical protein